MFQLAHNPVATSL